MSIDSIAVVVSSIHVNTDTGETIGACMCTMGIVSVCSETAISVVPISISK